MKEIRVGLIGTGYIGRTHAIAYAQAPTVFPLKGRLIREMVADMSAEQAHVQAKALGFRRSTGDWRELVADPNIDVVDICTPNFLHKEMALEAIKYGKHVYCEKPLALNSHDAKQMVEAVARADVKTLVGFNYMKNPTAQLAKEIIANGEIGEIVHFYGTHNEDYMADALSPIHWHCFKDQAGFGALGDLAVHIINMAQYLVGEIMTVCGDMTTVVKARPEKSGSSILIPVENEDQAHVMVRFNTGAMGIIEASRIACGRKMGLNYVVTGTKGTLSFTQERMAELKLYLHDEPVNRQGFKTILVGPEHPDYAPFCNGAGHGIGFNDQKTVEVRDLVDGIALGQDMWPDFTEGWKVSRILDAILCSHQEKRWVNVTEIN
ncbi:Gfo/Idh/MocA family protein [Xenorhabdus hominickii]|uniref:Myo-inositol 2-dehydrogenase n=1 Tax=Xenorhabdus hominickii TaxID=351679 RepID=A0A2G0Q076_XENHO|nr:Gfo/Idh/MocA family oxidoreductase [Xenorhabdus hominickii]AOM42737.1 myo-inositol 2-dehydrogenase [Xenorhabdus hominickii]PHM52606.1 putative oxidoreductase [Xenorhabdus hominickii]